MAKTVFENWEVRNTKRQNQLKLVAEICKLINGNNLSAKYSEITETAIIVSGSKFNNAQIKIEFVL